MCELLAVVSAAEFALWVEWYQAHGFAADRQTWATANAGSAVAATWGGKVKPSELVPQFGGRKSSSRETLMAFFDRYGTDPNAQR